MPRRLIAYSLVPLLLLPGLAHAHAGQSAHDPSGLDRSPHIHLRLLLPWLPPQAVQDPSSAGEERLARSMDRHDDDAVYLSVSMVSGWRSFPQVVAIDYGSMMLAPGISVSSSFALRASEMGAGRAIVQLPACLLSAPLLI